MTSRATAVKDWIVNLGTALIVVVAMAGIAYGISEAHTNAELTAQSIASGNRHHDQNNRQQAQIEYLLHQHSADIANESQLLQGIAKADVELAQFAAWIVAVDQALCGSTHAACPAVPDFAPLPSP